MKFPFSELVGRYRLDVTDELRSFIERVFVAPLPFPEQAAARDAALREAEGSELEASADGSLVSRSDGQEFFRVKFDPNAELDELTFEKAPGVGVRLEFRDKDTVVAHQAGKLTVVFKRVR
jgi:hypothetical protein